MPEPTLSVPIFEAPSLENLEISVPSEPMPSRKQVAEAYRAMVRKAVPWRERARGEPVQLGDDVYADVCFLDERNQLVPFSPRFDMAFELTPNTPFERLGQQLSGMHVGADSKLSIRIPSGYSVERLRGVTVTAVVRIKRAVQISMPDLTSLDEVAKVGLGSTQSEIAERVQRALTEEAKSRQSLRARQLVLDKVTARARFDVSSELIDREITATWRKGEGAGMVKEHFREEVIQAELKAWLTDPATRSAAEHRLRVTLVLGAVAKRDGVQVDDVAFERFLKEHCEAIGVAPVDAMANLRKRPQDMATLAHLCGHFAAAEHVFRHAAVKVEPLFAQTGADNRSIRFDPTKSSKPEARQRASAGG